MIYDLFKTPIFYGDIDCKKIQFEKQNDFAPSWLSRANSTKLKNKDKNNVLKEESKLYLLKIIHEIMSEAFPKFSVDLINIWTNQYNKNDYQEPHIHPESHFSFIIYSNVKESKTYFTAPNEYLIEAFGMDSLYKTKEYVNLSNNKIIIFPSFLSHGVLPSNDQETISGNLLFKRQW